MPHTSNKRVAWCCMATRPRSARAVHSGAAQTCTGPKLPKGRLQLENDSMMTKGIPQRLKASRCRFKSMRHQVASRNVTNLQGLEGHRGVKPQLQGSYNIPIHLASMAKSRRPTRTCSRVAELVMRRFVGNRICRQTLHHLSMFCKH